MTNDDKLTNCDCVLTSFVKKMYFSKGSQLVISMIKSVSVVGSLRTMTAPK